MKRNICDRDDHSLHQSVDVIKIGVLLFCKGKYFFFFCFPHVNKYQIYAFRPVSPFSLLSINKEKTTTATKIHKTAV